MTVTMMRSTTTPCAILTLLFLFALLSPNHAFQVVSTTTTRRRQGHGLPFFPSSSSSLAISRVIRADDDDFDYDIGKGGVRLAMETAIKVCGTVKHKPGAADAKLKDLLRYNAVTSVDETLVQSTLNDEVDGKIICTGIGQEEYKDPGETIEQKIIFAPGDAVRDALTGAASAMEYDKIVINFLGGDDLQVLEVLDAVQKLVLMLDVTTKAKISFNSLSHSSFPETSVTLTVVGLPEESSFVADASGAEKSIAKGEVYFRDGSYWTVVEDDINTAVA